MKQSSRPIKPDRIGVKNRYMRVNYWADVLCATYGEQNREYYVELLSLGVDAMLRKKLDAKATTRDKT